MITVSSYRSQRLSAMVLRESISLSGSIRQIKTEINKGDVI
nr:MAG TPA: hypothetical protein [Caudoviricetes sp.]